MPPDWVQGFLVGFFASLAATGIAWLVTQRAWPRLRDRFQKGPVIVGEWESTFIEEDVTKHEQVMVVQVGQKISGTMILRRDKGVSIKSTFRGTIQSGMIKGLYESQSPEGFEQGAFMLKLNPRGNRAVGQYLYPFEPDEAGVEITPVNYSWDRK